MSRASTPSAGELLHELLGLLHAGAHDQLLVAMQASGLTLPQLIALSMLRSDGAAAVGDLAAHLGLSMSATSAIVQRLVEAGHVTRTEDPDDRRHKVVALTRDGATVAARIAAGRAADLSAGLAALPADLRRDLTAVLARACAQLRARAGKAEVA